MTPCVYKSNKLKLYRRYYNIKRRIRFSEQKVEFFVCFSCCVNLLKSELKTFY